MWESINSAPWRPRASAREVIHDVDVTGPVLVMTGGQGCNDQDFFSNEYMNEVWTTDDGTFWAQLPDAPWIPRADHGFIKISEKFWLFGGRKDPRTGDGGVYFLGDVWSSMTGEKWALEAETSVWGYAPAPT